MARSVCVVSADVCHHKARRNTRAEAACHEGNPPGGLSSRPWIFNGDIINTISKSGRGLSQRGKTYSVFCYADDLLIASTTSTGMQSLIDLCDSYYICQHGLRFNSQKTSCTTVGKHRLVSQPQWTIKGRQLKVTDTFAYPGRSARQ